MPKAPSIGNILDEETAPTRANSRGAAWRAQPKQLELRAATESIHAYHWRRWREELRAAVDEIGLKTVAFDLDIAPSDILHALAGHERHYFRAEWALYLALRSKQTDAAAYPAHARGLDVTERPTLTPEDKVERYERVLKKYGAVGAQIWREAIEEDR